MTLAKNIRYLRKLNEWSQEYLADKLGYKSYTTIQKWEMGISEPPLKVLQKLAEAFNVDMDDLASRDLESPDPSDPSNSKPSSAIRINVVGSVPAGIPIEAIEDIVDWEELPARWGSGGREYFGLKVKGDSMYPKYIDGDTVILEKREDCESGDDCVVYVNGYDATLKKVIKKTDCIILQPLNPAYEPRIYDYNDEANPIKVAGVVVQLRRNV